MAIDRTDPHRHDAFIKEFNEKYQPAMTAPNELPTCHTEEDDHITNWLGRLEVVVETLSRMGKRERAAALGYLRSVYKAEWPSDY